MKPLREAPVSRADETPSELHFSLDALPHWMRPFVEALALFTQTPVDLTAMVALGVLSAACAKTAEVAPAGRGGEPLNLYTMTVMESGTRKSPVFSALAAPLWEFQRHKAQELADARRERATHREWLTRQYQSALGSNSATRAQDLAKQLEAHPPIHPPRVCADDCTPEKLVTLLEEHKGRMAILSAEGVLVDHIGGLYTSRGGANLNAFLKAHSGEPLQVDRRDRSELVLRPALTLGLAVQPEVLHRLFAAQGAEGRGLLARVLYCLPEDLVGYRDVNPPCVPDAVRQHYHDGVRGLLELEVTNAPQLLHFTPEATARLHAFERELEPRLRKKAGDLGGRLRAWANKLSGALVRIAGLLHVAEHGPQGTVSADTLERALRLGPFFIDHARRAFEWPTAIARPALHERVFTHIARNRQETFSQRELQSSLGGGTVTADELTTVLADLEARGFLERVSEVRTPGTSGRPPSPRYRVTPTWRGTVEPDAPPEKGEAHIGSVDSVNPLPGRAPPRAFRSLPTERPTPAALPAAVPHPNDPEENEHDD